MKLLDQVRQLLRTRHYSYRTERTYCQWMERFIRFHGIRHPAEMGAAEIEQFLAHLALERHVSASTQNQAFNAILFLYLQVLKRDPGKLDAVIPLRVRDEQALHDPADRRFPGSDQQMKMVVEQAVAVQVKGLPLFELGERLAKGFKNPHS